MADRPILFSAPMVRALLAHRKTETRRTLNPQPFAGGFYDGEIEAHLGRDRDCVRFSVGAVGGGAFLEERQALRFAPGDRLWVREAWAHDGPDLETVRARYEDAMGGCGYGPYYRATEPAPDTLSWRPSIHMPRWASRLTLIVTDVRVQRLQDISEADAEAEGCESEIWDQALAVRDYSCPDGWFCSWGTHEGEPSYVPEHRIWRESYRTLWDSIHGVGAWDRNPWVCAITFHCIHKNIDALEKIA